MFEVINIVVPDPKTSFWIPAFNANTAVINTTGIRTPLANGLNFKDFSLTANEILYMIQEI